VLTVIDEVSPAIDGITVQVATSVTTQLVLENRTATPVEVLDDAGQPFLRIGAEGVDANLAAPAWYLTSSPLGTGSVPPTASATAAPRWASVSVESTWGWFDHRLHPAPVVGSALGTGRRPTFEVPLRYGDRTIEVRGHLERRATVPRFAARLREVPDAASGLVVQLADGRAPGLFARYDGSGEAVVAGRDGEPFLRLSPAGAEVNRRSPTYAFAAQARGEDLAGIDADPAAPPEWSPVASSPSYAWIDPRAVIEQVDREPVTLDWSVPATVDGRAVEIAGTSTARLAPLAEVVGTRSAGRPGAALAAVGALAVLAVGALVWLVRGRG
jgi:hypothetical protein